MIVKKYKNVHIHYVYGSYKYDLYQFKHWIGSTNTLREARQIIRHLAWLEDNYPR